MAQVTNQVVDMGLLAETAAAAKEVLGVEQIAAVADKGYLKIEDIEACETAGIDPYVPSPQRGRRPDEGLGGNAAGAASHARSAASDARGCFRPIDDHRPPTATMVHAHSGHCLGDSLLRSFV